MSNRQPTRTAPVRLVRRLLGMDRPSGDAARAGAEANAIFEPLESRRLLSAVYGPAEVEVSFYYPMEANAASGGASSSPVVAWNFDYGDGSPLRYSPSSSTSVVHAYTETGTYRPTATPVYSAGGPTGRPRPLALDRTFSSDGVLTTDLSPGARNLARGMAVDADGLGRFVVAGEAGGDFALARFLADGSPDASFGTDGRVLTDLGTGDDRARAVAAADDGTLVVAGTVSGGAAVARYRPDGSLDPAFGNGGRVVASFARELHAVDVYPDGRILAAGIDASTKQLLARFNPDGTLDATFADGGVARHQLGGGGPLLGVERMDDGRIAVAGMSNYDGQDGAVVARFTDAGAPDPTFGNAGSGHTRHVIGGGLNFATGLAVLPDGGIAISRKGGGDVAVTRFTAAGQPDAAFGANGTVTTDLGGGGADGDEVADVVALPDGRLLVAGDAGNLVAFVRYLPDGSPDPTFGVGGVFVSDVAGDARAVALLPDGRAVVAGRAGASFSESKLAAFRLLPDNAVVVTDVAAPTDLSVAGGGAGELALSWTDNATYGSSYEVERSPDGTTGWTSVATIAPNGANAEAYTDAGLPAGALRFYRVRAVGFAADTFSDWSNVASARVGGTGAGGGDGTPTGDVPAVTGLLAAVASPTQVNLDWNDAADPSISYRVHRGTAADFAPSAGNVVADGLTDSRYVDRAVPAPAGVYYYKVVAVRGGLASPTVAAAAQDTSAAPSTPEAPGAPVAVANDDGTVTVSWSDNSLGEAGFVVLRSENGQAFVEVGQVRTNEVEFTDGGAGVPGGASVTFKVQAQNAGGRSPLPQQSGPVVFRPVPVGGGDGPGAGPPDDRDAPGSGNGLLGGGVDDRDGSQRLTDRDNFNFRSSEFLIIGFSGHTQSKGRSGNEGPIWDIDPSSGVYEIGTTLADEGWVVTLFPEDPGNQEIVDPAPDEGIDLCGDGVIGHLDTRDGVRYGGALEFAVDAIRNHGVKYIIPFGYSHGGGAVDMFTELLAGVLQRETDLLFKFAGMPWSAYIDAMDIDFEADGSEATGKTYYKTAESDGFAWSENDVPELSSHHFNIFQDPPPLFPFEFNGNFLYDNPRGVVLHEIRTDGLPGIWPEGLDHSGPKGIAKSDKVQQYLIDDFHDVIFSNF